MPFTFSGGETGTKGKAESGAISTINAKVVLTNVVIKKKLGEGGTNKVLTYFAYQNLSIWGSICWKMGRD